MTSAHDNKEYIKVPKAADVLFGRGSGPNDHEGNILFRRLVRERKAEYMSTNHRQTKTRIAEEVVDQIRSKNGLFLKKADAKDLKRLGLPEETEVWCRVKEKNILEKAKQALRQKADTKDYDREDDGGIADKKVAAKGAYPVPAETVSYGHEHPMMEPAVLPDAYISGELPASQEPLDWQSYQEPVATAYLPHPPEQQQQQQQQQQGQYIQQVQYNEQPTQAFLAEGAPPVQRYADTHPQRSGDDLDRDGLAKQDIHHAAAQGYSGDDATPIGDGPEDDARRKSLQVEDLMCSFHRMGTDEMATSSSDNIAHTANSSSETMGTIEPLPMGAASNQSMMTSSTFSILKGAFGIESASPRGSITRPGKYKRETSTSTGSGSKNDSSDMSLSFSNLDGVFGDSGGTGGYRAGNQVSQVLEGANEDGSQEFLPEDPRPVAMMEEDPDSLPRFGSSSINMLTATLSDSADTAMASSQSEKTSSKK